MRTIYGLVFFATGWGPTKGGINSFNFDLCRALGKQSDNRSTTVFCICPGTTTENEKREAGSSNIELIDIDEKDFNNCSFNKIISEQIITKCERIFWFGHDVITGKQACTCRDGYKDNSKAVVFHHMNYGEYYAIGAPERTAKGEDKESEQKQIFKNADYAIAVGPKLFTSLNDLKTKSGSLADITQIIPGLADIVPIQEEMHNKTILFTGRLENDNDPIKQYSITIYAVSDLFKNKDAQLGEIELKLYGLDAKTQDELNKKIEVLKNSASQRAECAVPIKPLAYTSNRDALFEEVRNSSIVIMPSISEGFGLAGFEGIAAGIPTIVSINSGLYEFLRQEHLDSYITGIKVVGGTCWEIPGDQDVANAYQSFKRILKNYTECKQNALELRQKIIELGYTWEKTAMDILDFLNISKLNAIAKLLCGVIDDVMRKKYSTEISKIANSCVNNFAQSVADEFKIDKDSILSLKVEKFRDIPYSIMSLALGEKELSLWRSEELIRGFVLELINRYSKEVTDELKRIENCDSGLSGLFVIDKKPKGTYKTERLEDKFAVVFREDNKFHEDITRLLEEANINAVLSEKDNEILKTYHQELKKTYNVLNFDGLSVMVSAGARIIPLDKVYASMNLKSESRESDFDVEYIVGRVARYRDTNKSLSNQNKRVIIKGDPGSGKSTYLKNQLMISCDSDKKYMCIFFKISGYIKWLSEEDNKGISKQLSEYVSHVLSTTNKFCEKHIELKSIYNKLRNNGGIAYFIDGLDEVQDSEQKKQINQQITDFVKEAESCKYILTSRKVGLDEEFFKSMDFAIEEIAPLSKTSIESYITKWYEVVGKIPGDTHHLYKQRAKELIASIIFENNSQLLNLAGNPLLLTIIVILHHHGINPPSNRAMLYSEITKTLLVNWMERRNFEIKYPADYLNNFLSRVAFEIVTNYYSTMAIPESKMRVMYAEYLSDSYDEDDENDDENDKVDSFIRYISDDAGILSPQGFLNNEQLYGFLMHRQIAEYYAALALENELELEKIEFSSIIHESKWTEVSILMGGNMSMQAEAGQNRVNRYIKDLFKTKSRPIEDFKYNILLILKWVANSTFISKGNLDYLLKELDIIFKSSNRYRVLQFCDDIVNVLNNNQCKRQICDWLVKLIDASEFISIRNASVVINTLLKSKELYKDILEKLTDDKIIESLMQLIEHRDFEMLYRNNGCYHTLFMDYFIKCMNKYYASFKGTKREGIWREYTSIYANAVSHSAIRHYGSKLTEDLTKLLEQETNGNSEKFSNPDILNEYIHMLVLYTIGFEIAEDSEMAASDYKDFCENAEKWDCKLLIDSAINLSEDESSLGEIAMTYLSNGIRIFHKKDKNGHKLTIFLYNREMRQLEKNIISLKNDFCLDDIKNQIDDNSPVTIYHCLDQLSEIEMSQEKLKEIFNFAYDHGRLLTKADWHQSLFEKISTDNESFYKYYDTLKRWVNLDEKDAPPRELKGELKTYYKYLAKQRKKITTAEIKRLITLYKKEENDMHKYVMYDILYDLLHSEGEIS